MPSPEGMGLARAAWEAWWESVDEAADAVLASALGKPIKGVAVSVLVDQLGFWLAWHRFGGFEGLRALGMPRTTIYRRIKTFRQLLGEHPDVFRVEGVRVGPRDRPAR
jgi:hypothetical protein